MWISQPNSPPPPLSLHFPPTLLFFRRSGTSRKGFRLRVRNRVPSQGGSWIRKPSAFRPKRTSPKKKHAIGHEVSAPLSPVWLCFFSVTPTLQGPACAPFCSCARVFDWHLPQHNTTHPHTHTRRLCNGKYIKTTPSAWCHREEKKNPVVIVAQWHNRPIDEINTDNIISRCVFFFVFFCY